MIKYMYTTTEQSADHLASSRCVVDLTSGILLGPSQEKFLSSANALKVKQNRNRIHEDVSRITKTRLPSVSETDIYHGLLYREVGYIVRLGAAPVTAI